MDLIQKHINAVKVFLNFKTCLITLSEEFDPISKACFIKLKLSHIVCICLRCKTRGEECLKETGTRISFPQLSATFYPQDIKQTAQRLPNIGADQGQR